MNISSPDWAGELQTALSREFNNAPRLAMLATADVSGHPRIRAIVIRQFDADGSIWFVTDTRSEKVRQIAAESSVEMLIWLASQRIQYRIQGVAARAVDRVSLLRQWDLLSAKTRTMFVWPASGEPRDDVAMAQATPPSEIPLTFAVYRVVPSRVDFLSVAQPLHVRWIASETDRWVRHPVNP